MPDSKREAPLRACPHDRLRLATMQESWPTKSVTSSEKYGIKKIAAGLNEIATFQGNRVMLTEPSDQAVEAFSGQHRNLGHCVHDVEW